MSEIRPVHVAFRHVTDAEPTWQYYGLDLPVVGGADTLAQAQSLAVDAAEFVLGASIEMIPVLEWQAVPASDEAPAVYVRTLKTPDAQWPPRSDFAQWLRERIAEQPGRCTSFANQLSSTGDIVACAILPDDPISQALAQTPTHGTVHFAMPTADNLCWLAISGPDTDERAPEARPLRDLGISNDATMRELMARIEPTCTADTPVRSLTLA
ncbi:hypothetical protein [Tomitella gaofuii]|uniref:hypothetical protein n=1 Tax=Tomitella gaofuii TaxID=2760083 RepID=UPI0015F87FDA|nr:hypothetical protein [Tomitella gaofuii]